jgi:Phosphate-induced protein 1 conserved region
MSRLPSRALHPLAVALAVATLAAACSEPPTTPSRPVVPQSASLTQSPEFNDLIGNGHIMHTRGWFESQASDNASKGGGGSQIVYHGGPVLLTTNVAAVYWAASQIYNNGPTPGTSGAGSSDASLVGFFLSHLGGSPYFNINTTYYDGSGTHISNVVKYTQYWANNTNAPSGTQSVSDAQMLAMLQSGFASGALSYDASTVYAIFTSGQVNLGGGFGSSYCAYHNYGSVMVNGTPRTVLYAAMPYNYTYPSACTSGFAAANGATDPGADYEVNTLAHEIEEATTDPNLNAWFDRRGFENADKCAWTWGTTFTTSSGGVANVQVGGMNFLVQRNWLRTGGCAQSL